MQPLPSTQIVDERERERASDSLFLSMAEDAEEKLEILGNNLEVSLNGGTPKWMVSKEKSH